MQTAQQTQVPDPFKSNSDRVGINILSDYCRLLADKRYYDPVHEIRKFSDVLVLFAEVCPVIYYNNVERQLQNLAAYFRKRLLQQQIFVVKAFMAEIRERQCIMNENFFHDLSCKLDSQDWNNDITEEEKETIILRKEAKKQYERVLPLYTQDLIRMYPNIPSPFDDESLYRVLNIYGGHAGGDSADRSTPFQYNDIKDVTNVDKKTIEKEFEIRSRYMQVKKRSQNQHQPNNHNHNRGRVNTPRRNRNNQNTIQVRPVYNSNLTKEALQHHHQRQQANMRSLNPYANPYEEFWHPYTEQARYPSYPGRRALSDGGFEVEDPGDHNRPQKARSDDAGPIYRRHQGHMDRNDPASFDIGMQFDSPDFDAHYGGNPHPRDMRMHHQPMHSPRSHNQHSPRGHDPRSPHGHNQNQVHPSQHHLRQHLPSQKYLRQYDNASHKLCTPSPPPHMQPPHHVNMPDHPGEGMFTLTSDGSFNMDANADSLAEWRNAFRV